MRNTISVKDISLKNSLHHKSRTMLTILTAALSVALIFVVLTYFHSDDQRQKREAINELGAYHVQYEHLTTEQLQQITANPKIGKYYLSYFTPEIASKMLMDLNIYMTIGYTEGINGGLIELREGQAPVKENEIVLDQWVIEELGYAPKLGQQITLNLQVTNGSKTEEITETFKLVGITDDIAVRKAARAGLMFISKAFAQRYSSDPNVTVFALLKSDFNASSNAQKVGEKVGLQDAQIEINERYTGAYERNPVSILQSILVVLVIVLSAGIVIYNIFNIYIDQQILLFGTMKAIGMGPRQLRHMIHTEGLIISLIGSCVGILLGIGGSLAFIPFLGSASASSMYVEITPYIVGGSFMLGLILVTLSIHVPARRVGRISEIAAIRYNPAADTGKRSSRTRLNNSLSILTLVFAQIIRHRKRTWITIISITLTGLVYLVAGSILSSMNTSNLVGKMVAGDYKLSSSLRSDEKSDPINNEVIKQIQSMEGVQSVLTEMYDGLTYNRQDASAHLSDLDEIRNPYISTAIYGYDDALMQRVIKGLGKGGLTLDEMKNGNYLIAIADGGGTYQAGDKIRMAQYGKQQEEREFTVVAVLPSYISYKGNSEEGGSFIAHQSMFKQLGMDQRIKQLSVAVDKEQQAQVEQGMKAIAAADRKIEFGSFREIYQEFNGIKKIMELAAYGFIAALMVISIFNLVNSNLTSMISRKREISMIEAIGLSRGQLTLQLGSEGLIVIVVSLLLTFVVGIPAGYLGVEMFSREATYVQYQFPLEPVVMLICSYLTVQALTTLYMQRRFRREGLMERIRYSE
ncbi:MAG TPA: FtsX-like permease family protein [Paenibacillus sp.]